MLQKPHVSGKGLGPKPEAFGAEVTADHIALGSEISQGRRGERDALVILDRATSWIDCYPLYSKSADETYTPSVISWGPR